jgi:hypothetical protein
MGWRPQGHGASRTAAGLPATVLRMQSTVLRRRARRRLLLLAVAIAGAFGAAVVFLPHDPEEVARLASAPAPLLAAATIGAWTLLTPSLISGTLLAAATGMLLGGPLGMPVALVGATLGSVVAFFLARRLAPGSPATVLNYAAGLTRIQLRHFVAGIVDRRGSARAGLHRPGGRGSRAGAVAGDRGGGPAHRAGRDGHRRGPPAPSPCAIAGRLLSEDRWTIRSGSTASRGSRTVHSTCHEGSQALFLSRSCSRSWAASSTSLWRHSAAR